MPTSLLLILCAAAAEAEDTLPDEIVTGPSSATDLSTGIANVVDPEEGVGGPETLAELLADLPGLHLRRAGSLGNFSSLSIRGLGGDHVAVVLDDVPMSSATLSPVDLGLIPLGTLERVEVYRGAGPVRFESPLGGVVRLVTHLPRDRREASAHLGYGSWQTRTAHAGAAGPLWDGTRGALSLAYQGSTGNFRYYDDRYTLSNTTDDVWRRRKNNGFDQGYGRGTLEVDGPKGSLLRLRLGGKLQEQGVAGPGLVPTTRSAAAEREGTVRLSLDEAELAPLRLAAGVDVFTGRRRFRDPLLETGLMVGDVTTHLVRFGADARLELESSPSHVTELAPRWSVERYRQDGSVNLAGGTRTRRERTSLGAGLEHRADLLPQLRLVPSLRADSFAGKAELSPRLGALLKLEPCELRLNAGRFHRLPSSLELYGDDVTTVPNLDLVPERGLSADAGTRCKLGVVHVDLAAFATRAERLIVLSAASQMRFRAENLRAASLRGLEAGVKASHGIAGGELAYTLMSARTDTQELGFAEKTPPGLPRHRLSGAVDLGPKWLRARYEVTYVSATPLVLAGTLVAPARLLHDVFVSAELGFGLTLKLAVTNLSNLAVAEVPLFDASGETGVAKVSDFIGYPLPGRGAFVSLVWRSS